MKEQNLDKDFFNKCWDKKSSKFRHTIYQKVVNKGIEPTFLNCKRYWYGLIKPYKNPKTGNVEHLHVKEIKKRRRIYGTTRPMENKYRKKNRKPYK